MDWLLILTIFFNGHEVTVPWALTNGPESCAITGQAVALILQAGQPGAVVQFSCLPQVAA